ncbi:hypothetical protein [Jatrophihabitans endophyticus]|uniref:hypothetical protein n=1 Tax=Jatrophihabitans endophyticus TaxID=1206085 RepID=UPI0019F15CDE|nr:hypothetical protein [Jatrophihabitans endophyticus]MBE7188703.1 hypothetical protein [Jatrophihabitans endophyticus]
MNDDPGRDVEFLTGELSGEDEVLDTGPRRPVPRWALIVGVLVVLALIVTAVVQRGGGGGTPVAVPSTPAPTTTAPTVPPTQYVPNIEVSAAYSLVGDERERRLFALSGAQLFAIGLNGQQIGHGVPVQVGDEPNADVELVLDGPAHVIWAVPQNATGHDGSAAGFAEPFGTRALHAGPRIPLPGLVESAAALDGTLYVSTSAGLWRTTSPGAPFEQVANAPTSADAMLVADPARHRLLDVLFGAHRPQARVFRLGEPISAPHRLPSRTISLAVVGRTIWLGGSQHGHALLTALDPATLRPGPDVVHGGSDVGLEGTGRRSLYVSVGPRLLCLDGSTGRRLADLGRSRGSFASVGGRGFFGTQSALHPVAMGRCPG